MIGRLRNASSLEDLHDVACNAGLEEMMEVSAFDAVGTGRKAKQLRSELEWLTALVGDGSLASILSRGDDYLAGSELRGLRRTLLRAFTAYLTRAARSAGVPAVGTSESTAVYAMPVPAARRARAQASMPDHEELPDPEVDPADYMRWAEQVGLYGALDVPLWQVVEAEGLPMSSSTRYRPPFDRSFTVADFLEGSFPFGVSRGDLKQIRKLVFAMARQLRRDYFQAVTEEQREDLCCRTMPDGQPVPAVVAALQQLRQELRRAAAPLPHGVAPKARVELVTDAEAARIVCEASDGVTVAIGFRQGRKWTARSSCDCDRFGEEHVCQRQLARVDELLRAVRMPDTSDASDVMRRLVDWAGKALWERGLDEASALLLVNDRAAAGDTADERLWWAVSFEHGASIDPLLQKRGKRGDWLKPRKVSAAKLGVDVVRTGAEDDAPILNVWQELAAVRHWGYVNHLRDYGLLQVLRRLVGHPRVCWADRVGQSIAVSEGELGVHLDQTRGGVRFEITAAGRTIASRRPGAVVENLMEYYLLCEETALVLVPADPRRLALGRSLVAAGEIPASGRQRALELARNLESDCPVQLGDELKGSELTAEPRLVARLTPCGSAGLQLEVLVRTLDNAPLYPPGDGPAEVIALAADGSSTWARRSFAAEEALAARVLAPLRQELAGGYSATFEDPERALQTVERLQQLQEVTCTWPEAKGWTVLRPGRMSDLSLKVRDAHDWFGVDGGVEIDGEKVALSVLLDAIRRDKRYVRIDEARWVSLEDDLRQRLTRLEAAVHVSRGKLELGATAAPLVESLADSGADIDASARWRTWAQRLDASRALEPEVPAGVTATLRGYQQEGYAWLARLAAWGVGCCLADDMGLGKTLQALCVVSERGHAGPTLVVAPVSVCDNWAGEMQRFVPNLRPISYRGAARQEALAGLGPNDVLICSYALAARDIEVLSQVSFTTLVLDEAQAIKNPTTQRSRAIAQLQADWAVALTGTPIENHLGELWALFRVLSRGLFGSWSHFRQRFAVPITNDDDEAAAEALAALVRPFVLRRTKGEVARDLPPRTTIDVDVRLSKEERQLYDETRLTTLAQLGGANDLLSPEQRRFRVLAAITRLRQLACHPRLVDANATTPSAKLDRLLELVAVLIEEGQRALVFSQFVTHLSLVRERLDAEGISYAYLDGSTPGAKRAAVVEAFQQGNLPLFLISLKAGGSGLNLTAADNVIHLDPWWNPAVEDQASDRAHRIGQTKPVTIYRLVSRGTIEEAILQLHRDKRRLVEAALSGSGAAAGLSSDELVALIRGAVP